MQAPSFEGICCLRRSGYAAVGWCVLSIVKAVVGDPLTNYLLSTHNNAMLAVEHVAAQKPPYTMLFRRCQHPPRLPPTAIVADARRECKCAYTANEFDDRRCGASVSSRRQPPSRALLRSRARKSVSKQCPAQSQALSRSRKGEGGSSRCVHHTLPDRAELTCTCRLQRSLQRHISRQK